MKILNIFFFLFYLKSYSSTKEDMSICNGYIKKRVSYIAKNGFENIEFDLDGLLIKADGRTPVSFDNEEKLSHVKDQMNLHRKSEAIRSYMALINKYNSLDDNPKPEQIDDIIEAIKTLPHLSLYNSEFTEAHRSFLEEIKRDKIAELIPILIKNAQLPKREGYSIISDIIPNTSNSETKYAVRIKDSTQEGRLMTYLELKKDSSTNRYTSFKTKEIMNPTSQNAFSMSDRVLFKYTDDGVCYVELSDESKRESIEGCLDFYQENKSPIYTCNTEPDNESCNSLFDRISDQFNSPTNPKNICYDIFMDRISKHTVENYDVNSEEIWESFMLIYGENYKKEHQGEPPGGSVSPR